jgi:hypothetical protein
VVEDDAEDGAGVGDHGQVGDVDLGDVGVRVLAARAMFTVISFPEGWKLAAGYQHSD